MIYKSHDHLATLVESQKKETEPAVREFYIYQVTEILSQNFITFVGRIPKPSYPMAKSVSLLQYVFSFVIPSIFANYPAQWRDFWRNRGILGQTSTKG
ncbi:hypothetical protein BZL39_I05900 [Zygosaccharomyces parabailii]|nr:hypothetical protein BZL39_I05900 [Zygosaccharomyces parabailii]